MTTRGRKPTPTALRLVKGNPGKRPMPKNEAKPPPLTAPVPPDWLNDDAKVEWGRVVDTLLRVGLLSELDRAALSAYCQAYGRWAEAERALALMAARDGPNRALMVRTSNGNAIQNPLVSVANKARDDVVRYAGEFGMTPAARARVQARQAEDEDGTAEFFGR